MARSKLSPGPIGIFDSGFGGLSIFKDIQKALPDYDYIYLGDNARAPYGTRSFAAIYKFTVQAVNYLFEQGCNLIILACNTASAKALKNIQQINLKTEHPDKRVLGILRPTTEIIGQYSESKQIGILATPGTVNSNSYVVEINKFFPEITVHQQACPMWVPLIENFEYDNPGADYFIEKNVKQLLAQKASIDTVLLACTHYPIIEHKIKQHLPGEVKVITQGEIVAKSLVDYLQRNEKIESACSKNGGRKFMTTGDISSFKDHATFFMKEEVEIENVEIG